MGEFAQTAEGLDRLNFSRISCTLKRVRAHTFDESNGHDFAAKQRHSDDAQKVFHEVYPV